MSDTDDVSKVRELSWRVAEPSVSYNPLEIEKIGLFLSESLVYLFQKW